MRTDLPSRVAPWCVAHDAGEWMAYEVINAAGHAERHAGVFSGCHDFVWNVEFAEKVAHITGGHIEVPPYYERLASLCDAATDLGHYFPGYAGV